MKYKYFLNEGFFSTALLFMLSVTLVAQEKPNLLIIQTDEHNFRTLGCYRQQLSHEQAYVWGDGNNVETPNIDYLADFGVIFTKYYAAAPVCTPSRGTFVSGLYPFHTGAPQNNLPMHDDVITFSKVLSENGYKTGFVGKWHLDGDGKPQWTPERKFGFDDNTYMFNRGHWKKMELGPEGPQIAATNREGVPNYDLAGADEESFTTDFLTDRSIDFIKKNKDKPFSLYLSLPDPHGPDIVRPPYNSIYSDMSFEAPASYNKPDKGVPTWAAKTSEAGLSQAQYFGMVKCIDDNVGKLITCLRDNQLLDHTIIIFTSDHGDLRGEHHRHNKGVPLEASAKIPFIVFYPNRIPEGSVVNNAFNTVDFSPTILSFMGQKIPPQMEGRDFSKLLTLPKKQKNWEDITFIRNAGRDDRGKWVAAVTSRYKLVLSKDDTPWLINMENDPDEIINYIHHGENANVVKELARQLDNYARKYADPFLKGTKMAEDLKRLL